MERHLKHQFLPKFRGSMHQTRLPSALSSPIFSRAREKMGPPEARQKRPRRNESLQARLLILCARFFLFKPQAKLAVWVFLCKSADNLSVSASPSQHPYPFCPCGTFPPDRGNRPLGGKPFYTYCRCSSVRRVAAWAAGVAWVRRRAQRVAGSFCRASAARVCCRPWSRIQSS